jgi:ubiquinone/menaquinone biosynthesis C-methylase UbiE
VEDPKAIVRRGYDLVSRAYRSDDASELRYRPWLDQLEGLVPSGARVLDLGCGCGVPVARRLARSFDVIGVDLSSEQIARARELVPAATFICEDMANLSFPDESFAAITAFYSLIHLPLDEQPALLRNIARWLQRGGVFLTTVGHGAWTGREKDWLGVNGAEMWWSHADADTYRRWLIEAGLGIESEAFVPEGADGHTLFRSARP